jgi:predicted cupin superfamily sugar epimerase
LLPSNEVSRFHRLKSDEIWYFHAGSSLTIYLIDGKGNLSELKLGLNSALGELPQVIVPQGSIFGAVVNLENSFTLMGCMVSPGFDFNDFELMAQDPLLKKYPQHEKLIVKLT